MTATTRPLPTLALFVALSLAGLAAPARAAITFTTDAATFAAGASGVVLSEQNFKAFGIAADDSRLIGLTLSRADDSNILPGISFSVDAASELGLYGPNTNTQFNPDAANTNTVLSTATMDGNLAVSFERPQSAISLNLLGLNPDAGTLISVFSTAGVFLSDYTFVPSISGTGSFFGILATGDTQIGSIVLIAQGDANYVNIDSVRFQQPGAVPEPGSVALLGVALAGLGVAGARSRRRAGA